MSILNKIKENQILARKTMDKFSLSLLSTLFAEVEKVGKDKNNSETSDADAISVIKKFIANNNQCIAASDNVERNASLNAENDILNKYLPTQMTEEQMKHEIATEGLSGMPSIMKHFKVKFSGQYDNNLLAAIAKSIN